MTDTLDDDDLQWTPSRVVRPSELATEVAKLKQQQGRDILVFGSRQLWNALLQAGLVDEFHAISGPV